MKRNKIFLLFIGIAITITGLCCSFSYESNNDSKDAIEKEREVALFKSISLNVAADIILTQGTPQKLILKGEAEDLEKIITEVDGTHLKIKSKRGFFNLHKIKIYITMADIEGLSIAGSGSIVTQSSIKTDNLDLSIAGSGDIAISDLIANSITSSIAGSGSIRLNGGSAKIKTQEIKITGSGDISSENLETENVKVSISGSGNCRVFATGSLDASVSGSGDVLYKGKPSVNTSISGSGKVKHID